MGVAAGGSTAHAVLVVFVIALNGCATTIREEAGRAERRLAPAEAARFLGGAWEALEGGKRIFDIRVSGRARVLNGEGALVYDTSPLRLRLDVFGPHATRVLSLAQLGDTLAVELPERGEYHAGPVGDAAFARLTEGRAFTGPELLGALLGAYDAAALVAGLADTVAYATNGERVVVLLETARAHRFAYAAADSTLREYRQERDGRSAYRVRFADYRQLEGRWRPFRVELEDFGERRTVRIDVRRETFDGGLADDAYRLEPR